jgi:hypothetical protein
MVVQVHPSGLLGSIRHFSCLVAAAVGDSGFETRVWGTTTEETPKNHHAKRVALRVDVSDLHEQSLPERELTEITAQGAAWLAAGQYLHAGGDVSMGCGRFLLTEF